MSDREALERLRYIDEDGGCEMGRINNALPEIASGAQWRKAYDALLAKEKALTRARDALAAERRRLPMTKVEKPYLFEAAEGEVSLADLFDGRRQLLLYH